MCFLITYRLLQPIGPGFEALKHTYIRIVDMCFLVTYSGDHPAGTGRGRRHPAPRRRIAKGAEGPELTAT